MDSTLQTAWDLYNVAKREVFDDQFPDPVIWFYNKEKLKAAWLQYVDKANSCDNIVKQAMLNNSVAKYMQYMCDNF